MTISAATLEKLMVAGLTGEALLSVVRSIEKDMAPSAADLAHERKKEADRNRMAERRALYALGPMDWESLRKFIIERDGAVCAYCRDEQGPFHIDHVIPVVRGGTNDPKNLAVACEFCNLSKGSKTLEEWRECL